MTSQRGSVRASRKASGVKTRCFWTSYPERRSSRSSNSTSFSSSSAIRTRSGVPILPTPPCSDGKNRRFGLSHHLVVRSLSVRWHARFAGPEAPGVQRRRVLDPLGFRGPLHDGGVRVREEALESQSITSLLLLLPLPRRRRRRRRRRHHHRGRRRRRRRP